MDEVEYSEVAGCGTCGAGHQQHKRLSVWCIGAHPSRIGSIAVQTVSGVLRS